MKIVVTGCSGHVGGAIARHFCERNNQVIGINRHGSLALPAQITQISHDIASGDFLQQARQSIGSCDAVIHAAAHIANDAEDFDISRTNCLGTHQVLKLATALKAGVFVFFSSLSVLGTPEVHPVTELHPLRPHTAYAASKLYGEQLTAMASSSSMRTVALRISSPVGPHLVHRHIFRVFVENAMAGNPLVLHGKGTRQQDYVDGRDIAAAVASVLECEVQGIFNIGSGVPLSNLHLAQSCIQALHSKSEIQFSGGEDKQDDICWDLSIEKAARQLKYEPAYTIDDSIRDAARSFCGVFLK